MMNLRRVHSKYRVFFLLSEFRFAELPEFFFYFNLTLSEFRGDLVFGLYFGFSLLGIL